MFSKNNFKSVLIKTENRKTILVDAGIKGEMLAKAVLASGSKNLDAVFLSSISRASWAGFSELSKIIKIKRLYLPNGPVGKDFQNIPEIKRLWNGEEINGQGWKAKSIWGIRISRDGKKWINRGYSGRKTDSLSYRMLINDYSITTGANSHFASFKGKNKGKPVEFDIISRREYTQAVKLYKDKINVCKIQ